MVQSAQFKGVPIVNLTIGPKDYHVRTPENEAEWLKIVNNLKYDREASIVRVKVEDIEGTVRPAFIAYAVRNGYLREAK